MSHHARNDSPFAIQKPHLRVELTPADDGKVVLSGKFSQGGVQKGFHMPAWLYLDFDNGGLVRVGKVVVDGEASKDIKITLPKKPKRVLLNAFHDVLVTSVEVKQVN